MCDDVSANKSLYGNEHETPSTRCQLRTHAWRLSVMAWVARWQGKPIPSGMALWRLWCGPRGGSGSGPRDGSGRSCPRRSSWPLLALIPWSPPGDHCAGGQSSLGWRPMGAAGARGVAAGCGVGGNAQRMLMLGKGEVRVERDIRRVRVCWRAGLRRRELPGRRSWPRAEPQGSGNGTGVTKPVRRTGEGR
jgi:hypothetical protein